MKAQVNNYRSNFISVLIIVKILQYTIFLGVSGQLVHFFGSD